MSDLIRGSLLLLAILVMGWLFRRSGKRGFVGGLLVSSFTWMGCLVRAPEPSPRDMTPQKSDAGDPSATKPFVEGAGEPVNESPPDISALKATEEWRAFAALWRRVDTLDASSDQDLMFPTAPGDHAETSSCEQELFRIKLRFEALADRALIDPGHARALVDILDLRLANITYCPTLMVSHRLPGPDEMARCNLGSKLAARSRSLRQLEADGKIASSEYRVAMKSVVGDAHLLLAMQVAWGSSGCRPLGLADFGQEASAAVTELRQCLRADLDSPGPASEGAREALAELDRLERSLPMLEVLLETLYQ